MKKGIRKEVYHCEAYVSGKSMEDVMEEYGLENVVKLGSNENPYGPYPKAMEAMTQEISKMNIYPEKNFIRLKQELGKIFGVTEEYIGIGHGAGGVIETIARTFVEEGDEVILPQQSYRLYREVSKIMGGKVIEVPLTNDYKIDLKKIISIVNEKTKLIWLCNPNNPTGSVMNLEDFQELLSVISENTWVVVDEAYAEFTDAKYLPNLIPLILEHKNVLGIRTFSKYYGLAGGRIGYVIAEPEIIQLYDTVSEPFNANRIGLAGAVSTLMEDSGICKERGDEMIAARAKINQTLDKMGCTSYESHCNFVFFETPYQASEVCECLLKRGVIVRSCSGWGYEKHIRMTVGTKEENEIFITELSNVLQEIKTPEYI